MLTEEQLREIEGRCRGNLPTPPKVVLQLVQMVQYLERMYDVAWAAIPETDHFTFKRLARLKESTDCR